MTKLSQNRGEAVSQTKFFDAAGIVTGTKFFGVGLVEHFVGKLLHSDDSIRVLQDVNKQLLEANLRIINKLDYLRQAPTDPRDSNSSKAIPAIEFDLDMVENEQGIVQRYLDTNQSRISVQARKDINDDINLNGFWRGMGWITFVDPQSFEWAKGALGITQLDFMQLRHRVAIGKALVCILHQETYAEYEAYMKSRVLPKDHQSEPTPLKHDRDFPRTATGPKVWPA